MRRLDKIGCLLGQGVDAGHAELEVSLSTLAVGSELIRNVEVKCDEQRPACGVRGLKFSQNEANSLTAMCAAGSYMVLRFKL